MRRAACLIALFALGGCDKLPSLQTTPQWAVVDSSVLYNSTFESLKLKHPYPKEIDDNAFRDEQAEYERVSNQISGLRQAALERCMGQAVPAEMAKSSPPLYGSMMSGNTPPKAPTMNCWMQADQDQLIIDLKTKLNSYTQIKTQRGLHDQQVHQLIKPTIDQAIDAYAREHKLALVIDGGRNIAYNQSNQFLDISQGVAELIARNPH
jgi:hypothetical protein